MTESCVVCEHFLTGVLFDEARRWCCVQGPIQSPVLSLK